jgi:hypothetical protein
MQYLSINARAFFTACGGGPRPIILGKIAEKPDVKLLLGENCMILKKFSEGKAPINGPY